MDGVLTDESVDVEDSCSKFVPSHTLTRNVFLLCGQLLDGRESGEGRELEFELTSLSGRDMRGYSHEKSSGR